jgi:hypothetical protein
MLILKSNPLILIENLVGVCLYLFGTIGSYLRFGKFERRGRLDAIFLICMTWGFCSLMVSILDILKYNVIPTLHLEIMRAAYYLGAGITSLVFLAKNVGDAALKNRIGAIILMGAVEFIFAEALVFYFDLPYSAVLFSFSGLLLIYCLMLFDKLHIWGIVVGIGILVLPILPFLMEQEFNLEKLKAKREVAISKPTDIKLLKQS